MHGLCHVNLTVAECVFMIVAVCVGAQTIFLIFRFILVWVTDINSLANVCYNLVTSN